MEFTPDFPANEAEVDPKNVIMGSCLIFVPIFVGAILSAVFDGNAIWLILGVIFVCGFMGLCIILDRTAYVVQPAYRRVRRFRTNSKRQETFLPVTDESWVSIHREAYLHKGRDHTSFPLTLHIDSSTKISLYPQKDHLTAQKFAEQVAHVLHIGVRDHTGTQVVETDHKSLGKTLKERILESGEQVDFGSPPAHADLALEAQPDLLRITFPVRGSVNPWGFQEMLMWVISIPGLYLLMELDSGPRKNSVDLQGFLIFYLPFMLLIAAAHFWVDFKKNEYEGRSEEVKVQSTQIEQLLTDRFRTRRTSLNFSEIKGLEVVEGKAHKKNDESGVGHLVITGEDKILVVGNGTDLETLHWLRSALRTAIAKGSS